MGIICYCEDLVATGNARLIRLSILILYSVSILQENVELLSINNVLGPHYDFQIGV